MDNRGILVRFSGLCGRTLETNPARCSLDTGGSFPGDEAVPLLSAVHEDIFIFICYSSADGTH